MLNNQSDSPTLTTTSDPAAEAAELLEELLDGWSLDHPTVAPAFPVAVVRALTEVRRLVVQLCNARSDKDRARLGPEYEEARASLLAACREWDRVADVLPLLRRMRPDDTDEQAPLSEKGWRCVDVMETLLEEGWASAGIEALFTAELGPLPDDLRAALGQLGDGQREGDETAIATARLWIGLLLPVHLGEVMPAEDDDVGEEE